MDFLQNGRNLLRAAAVTRGWNGYRNKSRHRKLTLGKKMFSPFLPGLEPATFRPARVGRCTRELSALKVTLQPEKNNVSVTQKYAKVGADGLEPK